MRLVACLLALLTVLCDVMQAFVDFKREILKGAENSRTSKPIPAKLIKSFEESEAQKDAEVRSPRT